MAVECTTMSYSDYGDYGDEPRRSNRRATRDPAGPDKVQGSTAAAILIFVAIVGFGIGALIGNAGGDDTPTTEDSDGAPLGSPDDQDADSDDASSEEPTDGSTDDADGDDDEQAGGGEGITAISQQDGGEVAADESGRIGIQATLDSGEEGVTLRMERSLDGGQTWEDFCDACVDETSGGGSYSTEFWSGRSGENLFRVVGPDGLTSNPITVNVVDNDEDSD